MADSLWVMPFGKYEGMAVEDLQTYYLQWLIGEEWFVKKFGDGAEAIRQELKYRERFGPPEGDIDRKWNRR